MWYCTNVKLDLVLALLKNELSQSQIFEQIGKIKSSVWKSIEKIDRNSVCVNGEKVVNVKLPNKTTIP